MATTYNKGTREEELRKLDSRLNEKQKIAMRKTFAILKNLSYYEIEDMLYVLMAECKRKSYLSIP